MSGEDTEPQVGESSDFAAAVRRAEANEGLYRSVLVTAADPIILISDTGMILEVNPATERLFEYSMDQLVGNNVSMLMPEPYSREPDGYIERYLETGEARIIGLGREVEARKADGTVFPVALAVSEVHGPESRMFTGILHDLTGQKRAEIELRTMNEVLERRVSERTSELEHSMAELARSNRDLEQFAYIASHDLQAPLRNVRQGLHLLDEHLAESIGERFDEEADELRGLVVEAVDRMEDLIRGLLAYSRVHRSRSRATHVDLDEVVGEVLDLLRSDIAEVGAVVEVASPLPGIVADRTQVLQLVQNLVQNALLYRSDGSSPYIRIAGCDNDEEQVITVSDDGIGIDPSLHERIFDLFRRGRSDYPGVGMGLAICQRIVERHGGRIWVDSAEGAGATFTFTLPRPDHPATPA